MTTPGSGGGDTDDGRWPAEPAPPDGEQATTALPRRTGSYPYPYPEPAALPEPASHPEADHRPPAASPEPWQGPPATPPTGWAQPTGSAQPTGWTPPAYAPPASRPPSGPGWVAPATLPPGGPWPTGGAYDRPPYPDARPYDPTRAAPTEQHDATVPRYQPPPRGSHLPPYEEPLGPSAGPHPAQGEWPQPAPTGTGDADTDPAPDRTKEADRDQGGRLPQPGADHPRACRSSTRAATADGADRSGLTALTYAVMGNYAVDAALAVALANTLFFAAATAESTGKVLLYLLITVAPFAVIAPLIGPALDKLQHGRRIALGASSFARAVLAVVMALNFDSWVLYPCALGMLVLSKSFSVLKAAITPRVLPPDITLVKTNSRLTVFGLMAGGVAGAVAAALSWAFGSTGALILTGLLSVVGGRAVPADPGLGGVDRRRDPGGRRRPEGQTRDSRCSVTTTLWANGTIRVETGFLALFIAFVIKREYTEASGFTQLLLLGVVGVGGRHRRLHRQRPRRETAADQAGDGVDLALAAVAADHPDRRADPGLATAALVGSGRIHRVVAGQGLPGFGDPARAAGGQPGVGVRAERDGAAAVLGVRRRHRPADRRGLVVRARTACSTRSASR